MEKIATFVINWHLHPFIDHFTISLLIVALLADVVASLLPMRLWLRYAALALMIIGAAAAAGSWFTGGIDGHRTAKLLTPAARAILHDHARLGYYLMIAFAVLALWRLLVQLLTFMHRTRQIYLAVTFLAVIALLYQGFLGGELVYDYGAGTGLLPGLVQGAPSAPEGAAPAAAASTGAPAGEAASAAPSSLPTVFVPTSAPTSAPSAEATVTQAAPSAAATAAPAAGATH